MVRSTESRFEKRVSLSSREDYCFYTFERFLLSNKHILLQIHDRIWITSITQSTTTHSTVGNKCSCKYIHRDK